MRDRLLKKLASAHARHPGRMLVLVVLLTLVFGYLSAQLSVTMRWSDLLPENDPRTVQFNKIVKEFSTSTNLVVVVQGPEERIKQFSDELAPKITALVDSSQNERIRSDIKSLQKALAEPNNSQHRDQLLEQIKSKQAKLDEPLFKRVDYKLDMDFIRNHGLMLLDEADLKNMKDQFYDPNLPGLLTHINDAMEKEYVRREESISSREKEDNAVMFLDGLNQLVAMLTNTARSGSTRAVEKSVEKLLYGDPYMISYDERALVMLAIPNFSMTDMQKLIDGTNAVQAELEHMLPDYPDVNAGLSGFVAIAHDEMVYSQKSLNYTSVIALIAILMMLIISFRMLAAPMLALLSLLIGSVWAVGTAAVVVGQLNIMTQMMIVILFGLGIDFAIHLISGFTEWRGAGESIEESMQQTFLKSGKGVITGGLTTACAFLTLVIAHSRGMEEMGLVTGFGLLAMLIETFLLLPALLVLRERRLERRNKRTRTRDLSFQFLGRTGNGLAGRYRFTLIAAVVVTALLGWTASLITFDHNYMNIEPEGLESIALQDTILKKFDLSLDYAMILAPNPDSSRRVSEAAEDMGSVAMTEDISRYLPSTEDQTQRIPHLNDIRQNIQDTRIQSGLSGSDMQTLETQLERLEMNIIEMQDMAFLGGQAKVDNKCDEIVGDPEAENPQNKITDLLTYIQEHPEPVQSAWSRVQNQFAPLYKQRVLRMSSTDSIKLSMLPEDILDRYSNDSRDQFLVTAYPAANVWKDAQFLKRFVDDLEYVTPKATGMPPIFLALIEVIGRDGRHALMLTLVIVFFLLWLDFGKPRYALMAMTPLAVGLIWMVGFMVLTGQQFTVMNVMGLPMILGIGIDDGVHLIHRWLHEGKGRLYTVFASTGKAILLTSLTTMLAFGSLVFSVWRGFAQLGAALTVGVAACFLTSVVMLSGILGWIEKRKN
ncbi:MAG: MMPL family transporter [candidate division KSB1 bacterium]|nr:MMPL family transporter [candidate division KSB1 bacterium]